MKLPVLKIIYLIFLLCLPLFSLPAQQSIKLVRQDHHNTAVSASAFSPDASLVATGGFDGKLRIWDLNTGLMQLAVKGFQGEISDVCFHPGGDLIAAVSTATAGSSIVLFDVTKRKIVREISFPSSQMSFERKVFFSGRGQYLNLYMQDGAPAANLLMRYNTSTWERKIIDIDQNTSSKVENIVVKRNGNLLAFGTGGSGTEFILNEPKILNGNVSILREQLYAMSSFNSPIKYTKSNGRIENLKIKRPGAVRVLLSKSSIPPPSQLRKKEIVVALENLRRVRGYAFSPDGKFVAICAGETNANLAVKDGQKELVFTVIDLSSGIPIMEHQQTGGTHVRYELLAPDLSSMANEVFQAAYEKERSRISRKELSLDLEEGHLCSNTDYSLADVNNSSISVGSDYVSRRSYAAYGPNRNWILYLQYSSPLAAIVDPGSGKALKRVTVNTAGAIAKVNPNPVKTYVAQISGHQVSSFAFGRGLKDYERQPYRYIFISNYGKDWTPEQIRRLHYENEMSQGGQIVLKGHSAKVSHVGWSPKGDLLLSFDQSGKVIGWREGDWSKAFMLKAHDGSITASFAPKNTDYFLSAGTDQKVNFWKIIPGKLSKLKQITIGGVAKQLLLTKDRLHVYREDGILEIYDPKTGQRIWELFMEEDNYFIRYQEKYYTYSKNATPDIAFFTENRMYPFNFLDLKYNRPDVVLRAMGGVDEALTAQLNRAYKKRLEKAGITAFSDNASMPKITESGKTTLVTAGTSAEFKLNVNPGEARVSKLLVWVDNCLVIEKPVAITSPSTLSTRVQLASGPNVVQIAVQDIAGNRSAPVIRRIQSTSPQERNLYFIGIGVAKFSNGDQLEYVDNDVEEFGRKLLSRKSKDFDNIYIETLTNERATIANINLLKGKLSRVKENDAVILYYSGHGVFDNDMNYYLVPYYGLNGNLKDKCFPYASFAQLLDKIPARDKLTLVNACFSGEYDTDPKTFNKMMTLFGEVRKGNGSTVITSSRSDQSSFTGNSSWGRNSAFGFAALKGLNRSNDRNQDNAIDISEFYAFLSESIARETKRRGRSGARQTPTLRFNNQLGNFSMVRF